jgi:integrase
MSLFKRGHLWWTNFYLDGKRFQSSTGTSNRRQAELIEQKLKQEANLKRHQLTLFNPKQAFAHLAARFLSAGNQKFFHEDRLKHLLPFFGEMRVCDITKTCVFEYRAKRQSEDGPLKEATLNRDVAVLRRILYWAVEQNLILANPIAHMPLERERRTKKPVMGIADEQKLLGIAPQHLREIVIAALDTGMRRGELLSQEWNDVDLDGKLLFVSRSKTPEGEAREIPLSARLFDLLQSRACRQGRVFTFQGKSVQDMKTSWNTARRKAELSNHFRFHDLRHTFNTRLMEAGVIQEVRMSLMGHEPRTVHWGYTHVELPAKREAIRKLEEWCISMQSPR